VIISWKKILGVPENLFFVPFQYHSPMLLDLTYTTESFSAEIDAATYIADFRRANYFMQFCCECGNYGRRYGCPPFDYDPLSVIAPYQKVRILGVKIVPNDGNLQLSVANTLMLPVIRELNEELLALEKSLGGMAFGFAGSCPYCGEIPCARIDGEPCRHPDKVRPSLEAFGFDMSKTASDLLGLEIKWSHDGRIPEYLTLVCGVFY
jgi:predicted metal-binding protein